MVALGCAPAQPAKPERIENIEIYERDGEKEKGVKMTALNSNVMDPAMRAHFLVTADERSLIQYYLDGLRDEGVILDYQKDPANPALTLTRVPSGWVAMGKESDVESFRSRGYPVVSFRNPRDTEASGKMKTDLSKAQGLGIAVKTPFDEEVKGYLAKMAESKAIRGYDEDALLDVEGKRIRVEYAVIKPNGKLVALVGAPAIGEMLPKKSWYLFEQLKNEAPGKRGQELGRAVSSLDGFPFEEGKNGGIYDK